MRKTDREVLSACRAACAAADLTARRSGACAAVHPLRRAERNSPRQHGAPWGWTADAEHLRGAHLTARPRGRAARAEHLTVSIAHGSLTHRPFLRAK